MPTLDLTIPLKLDIEVTYDATRDKAMVNLNTAQLDLTIQFLDDFKNLI